MLDKLIRIDSAGVADQYIEEMDPFWAGGSPLEMAPEDEMDPFWAGDSSLEIASEDKMEDSEVSEEEISIVTRVTRVDVDAFFEGEIIPILAVESRSEVGVVAQEPEVPGVLEPLPHSEEPVGHFGASLDSWLEMWREGKVLER